MWRQATARALLAACVSLVEAELQRAFPACVRACLAGGGASTFLAATTTAPQHQQLLARRRHKHPPCLL